eukprot:gene3462-6111_t
MKFSFFLVAIFIASVYCQQGCSPFTFGNLGEPCANRRNSTQRCKQFLSCIGGRVFLNSILKFKGKCVPGWVGSACTSNSGCYLSGRNSENVQCVDGVCTRKRYNGYRCATNEQCFGNRCEGGVCVGLKEDEVCDPNVNVQCGKGLYCSLKEKKCKLQIRIGEECEDYVEKQNIAAGENYNVICPGGTRCLSIPGSKKACRKIGYLSEFDVCKYDHECSGILNCRSINEPQTRCHQPRFRETCRGATKDCDSLNGEQCICNENRQNPPTCKKTSNGRNTCNYPTIAMEWRDCWEKYNCPYDSGLYFTSWFVDVFPASSTCMSQHCGFILKKYLCCSTKGFDSISYSMSHSAPINCSPIQDLFITGVVMTLFLLLIGSIAGTSVIIGVILLKTKLSTNQFEQLE